MIDINNYYQRDPNRSNDNGELRFPANHVKFSPILKVVKIIDSVYQFFGARAFKLMRPMLKEFESTAEYDRHQGTYHEMQQLRVFLISYCEGIDQNPYLSSIGRYLLKTMGLGLLKNRKRVLQFYDTNKSFIDQRSNFLSPMIITGSGRSGTTLLQRLISEDPNTRSPYTFELEIPLPPMQEGIDPMTDIRIKKSSAGIKTLSKLASGFMEKFAESHLWSPTEMEESFVYTFAHNGINEMNYISAGLAHLHDVINLEDKKALFKYEKLLYKILDAYRPARSHWNLKSPSYAIYFPLIFEEYENAKVVLTHRNPLITLPSLCRLWESWCIAFDIDGSFDKHRFGEFIHFIHKNYIIVPFNFRKEHPEYETRIFDCVYEEFFADPINVVKRIYEKFDFDYSPEFEARMKIYLQNNQQGKYGRHTYSLEEYGFDPEHLYEEFRDYMDHYNYKIPRQISRPTSFDFLKNYN